MIKNLFIEFGLPIIINKIIIIWFCLTTKNLFSKESKNNHKKLAILE